MPSARANIEIRLTIDDSLSAPIVHRQPDGSIWSLLQASWEEQMTPTPCADIRARAGLAALDQVGLLGTPAEPAFDRLTRLTAQVLGSPMAIISLVGAEHVFFKSSYGLPEPLASRRQAPLSHSFCQIVVVAGAPLVVPDTRLHPLLHDDTASPE